jgi:hypothetical protein
MTKHVAKDTDNSFVILLTSEIQKSVFEEHIILLHRQSVLNVAQNKVVLTMATSGVHRFLEGRLDTD